ncbi:reverse transcriptase domain-containing protein [Tanacetum coccineum]
MCIELANKTTQFRKGIAENVMVKIDKFIFPVDFVILDMEEDHRIPIILGRPFLATAHAMIDGFNKKISFEVGDEIITFDLEKSMKFPPSNEDTCHAADIIDLFVVYSPWVSPIHVVPKKGRTIVITNKDNELVPTPTVTGWRVCIDYRKLNNATRKDHFLLPFIDQLLERLSGNEYYCFLDGFSGYFQIPLAPEDQEKTTFTCLYGTFAYRRMPFRLSNAPATFQRCMTAIFHDMCKDFMEVFMDDFSVFGVLKALISDRRTHFCNSLLEKTLKKYGVTHRLATLYHTQTSGQTENTNRAIKRILERTVNGNRKEWADKLDDALWAFKTTYKTPIGSTPFRIVYGKACHLPIELEHKAYWALKNTNFDLDATGKHRFLQLNQLDEFRSDAYEHSRAYKERTKRWHDSKIMDTKFQEREENPEAMRQFSRPARLIFICELGDKELARKQR